MMNSRPHDPGPIVFLATPLGFGNPLALLSLNTVNFEILVFPQPNGKRSTEQDTNTDGQITQLLSIPTNSKINFDYASKTIQTDTTTPRAAGLLQ